MKCQKCGVELPAGVNSCPKCGTQIPQSANDSIPRFTSSESKESDIPRFSSHSNDSTDIPRFSSHSGDSTNVVSPINNIVVCSLHPNNIATANCAVCGNPICDDCQFLTDDGENYICYNCAKQSASEDVVLQEEKKQKIIRRAIGSVVCAVIVLLLTTLKGCSESLANTETGAGTMRFFLVLFGAAIPVYLPWIGKLLKYCWKLIRWKPSDNPIIGTIVLILKFVVFFFALYIVILAFSFVIAFSPFIAIAIAIIDILRYKKAKELIERNMEILQYLDDYFEYTRIKSAENATVDQLSHDSRMVSNEFAQAVARNGFENASKMVASSAKEFSENAREIKKYIFNEYGEAVRAA